MTNAGAIRAGGAGVPSAPAPLPPAGNASSASTENTTHGSSMATPGSPIKEVPLQSLHRRSAPLGVANRSLTQGLDSARRLDALEWLVQAFDALNLPDTQLFAAFGLLDRFAAASPAPISAGPGAFALVLAAMLVALKVAGTQRDLERAKRLVVEVSGSSRPWAAVRRAELQILRRLGFRACTPTSRELLDRLLNDTLPQSQDAGSWDLESRSRCIDLARFLLELSIVHDPEAVYGTGRPPLAAALASLLLSLLALGAPRQYAESLAEPLRLLDANGVAVQELAEAMRQRWNNEERRAAGGGGCAVIEKWLRRVGAAGFGASPPSPSELRHLIGPKVSTSPGGGQGRRASVGGVPSAAQEVLATLPTPARRASTAGGQSSTGAGQNQNASQGQQSANNGAEANSQTRQQSQANGQARQPPSQDQSHHLPTPRPASNSTNAPQPRAEQSERYPPAQLVSQLSRAAATENLSSWPGAPTNSGSAEAQTGGSSTASSSTGVAGSRQQNDSAADRSTEPFVELTHVLNMVAPRPGQAGSTASGGSSSASAASRPRPPSVAAELLISSALRMQWPADKRKVHAPDGATICREAAAVLQEAFQQLQDAAVTLDSGPAAVREALKPPGTDTNRSVRRRTFGGPSPQRATSPGATASGAGATAASGTANPQRGSPPVVRFSGLRV
eukprot:TRINITY_DN48841_c0_g1_i1.p1 TRINITY_DN48841_c0_g1~~TRINITY_DN48841_c0_g1_i1.p1  ORF type:complete len:677 (-),score=135.44 TRINITY_DN48841_c0_g1_i1:168-2198(-)